MQVPQIPKTIFNLLYVGKVHVLESHPKRYTVYSLATSDVDCSVFVRRTDRGRGRHVEFFGTKQQTLSGRNAILRVSVYPKRVRIAGRIRYREVIEISRPMWRNRRFRLENLPDACFFALRTVMSLAQNAEKRTMTLQQMKVLWRNERATPYVRR